MKKLTVVMYHYVRRLTASRYPDIKGLELHAFQSQLNYFKKNYSFITMEDCVDALQSNALVDLPENAILLTFDDAYIDHYINVFPILDDMGIQGTFSRQPNPSSKSKYLM